MDAVDLIRRLHQHLMWVDDLLLAAVQRLTATELHKQFSLGQGSAQLVNMLRQLGHAQIPDVTLITLAPEEGVTPRTT